MFSKTLGGMYGQIRARSGALFQFAGLELGCSPEKDRRGAGALDRLIHAPFHRERNDGRHVNGEQALRKGEQAAN